MSETVALSRFTCPACGGEANWNPGLQKLVCPFCGTESPAAIGAGGAIVEHDLVRALRGIGDDRRGFGGERRQVRCQSCRAISLFDPKRQAQNCEFCGSAQLVPYAEAKPGFSPESVLPFRVSEADARNRIRAWTAEAGHYHYTTETYSEGGQTRTRQVRHVRWVPAAGRLSHYFDDDLVCASVGIHPGLLRAIEPFPTAELRPYDAGYVAGWVVERYQIDLVAAAQHARDAMDAKIRDMCAAQVPGDTHRNLQVHADYGGQTFKHILAPVWLLSYNYGSKAYQCAMNGVTGAIRGEYPKSPWKVALLALAILLVVWIVLAIGSH
mgnify:CR=1 FL=1